MILELNSRDFYKCSSLVNKNGQMEVKAVIKGINPGRIFVDDSDSPKTGLIWLGSNNGFFFIGNEKNQEFTNEISSFIDSVIAPEAMKLGLNWFEGIGNHPSWNTVIEDTLKHKDLGSWNQKVYTIQDKDYKADCEPTIEEDYSVHRINSEICNNSKIQNIDFLRNKIKEFWSSPDKFYDHGIGYCIQHKDEIVSVCFSGFVVDNVHCIDIETLKNHQGKKLAKKVAHHFARECLAKGSVPYWDCMEKNKPSVAVAESIGFKNVFNYVGYDYEL